MSSTRLTQQIDDWTIQILMATRHLARLYRILGDDRQAATALQSAGLAEERARRLGIEGGVASARDTFQRQYPDETDAEAAAWQVLVEAQAGICAFHAMVEENHEKGKSLRGSRIASLKAFRKALAGLRTAFPEPMAQDGITRAIHTASRTCAELFAHDLESMGDGGEGRDDELRKSLYQQVSGALIAESAL